MIANDETRKIDHLKIVMAELAICHDGLVVKSEMFYGGTYREGP
jgi:hypothetical protein